MSAAVRLLGAALVAFSGWAAGWWLTEKKRRRLAALEQLERLIALVQDEIVYRAAPLSEILALLKARRDMPGLCLEECGQLEAFSCPPGLDRPAWDGTAPIISSAARSCGKARGRSTNRPNSFIQKQGCAAVCWRR